MRYPYLSEVRRSRDMTSVFGGYNHKLSCQEGQFFDLKNITSEYFPILSPRQKRSVVAHLQSPQGIISKERLMWVDDGKLYEDGREVNLDGVELSRAGQKTLAKMGAFVAIFPDNVWYNADNGECGYMESTNEVYPGTTMTITLCDMDGSPIEYHDEAYYKTHDPKQGDHMMTTTEDGRASLKVYSASSSIWVSVPTTYLEIHATGIGQGFEEGDGVELKLNISMESDKVSMKPVLDKVFVNDEGDYLMSTNTTVTKKGDDYITIVGITQHNFTLNASGIQVKRKVPEMAYVTECNNRLWGCSTNGHEVYACKLGDLKNWNAFQGISTDSWAATIGSDGRFTGAVTYLNSPIFFKENSIIKIAVSSTGGHQLKETVCRGVQEGCAKSIAVLNETLFYKSAFGVCSYQGSQPVGISDLFADVRYHAAVGGAYDSRYYLSMKDDDNKSIMFVYDQRNGVWCIEDDTEALAFCAHGDDLFFIDKKDNSVKSVRPSKFMDAQDEKKRVKWYVESGNIGYTSPDNKYVAKVNIRISLEIGTNVDFYIKYDSTGEWQHKFNMAGNGTRTFTIPVIPHRCDHFAYKIIGEGGCKIHSITKTMEQGSDVNV